MAIGCSIPEYEFSEESSPVLVEDLGTGGMVEIELWLDGLDITLQLTDVTCSEVDATGMYTWALDNIPATLRTASKTQFHYRMTELSGSGNTAEGDFVLTYLEAQDGKMPESLSDYIVKL
jgi:hypothetical protein